MAKIKWDRGGASIRRHLSSIGLDADTMNLKDFCEQMERLHDKRIPLDQCKDRVFYRLHSRNLAFGVFDISKGGFVGLREKFGNVYSFVEYHYDAPAYATASPLEELPEELPSQIYIGERLPGTGCQNCEGRLEFKRDDGNPDLNAPACKGTWHHLPGMGGASCDNASPTTISNDGLFDWLTEMEERYGDHERA